MTQKPFNRNASCLETQRFIFQKQVTPHNRDKSNNPQSTKRQDHPTNYIHQHTTTAMLASPRRPLRPLNAHDTHSTHSTHATNDIDLYCYETMPSPAELSLLAEQVRARHKRPPPLSLDGLDALDALDLQDVPIVLDLLNTLDTSHTSLRACRSALSPRKRRRSPSPFSQNMHSANTHKKAAPSTQTIRVYHPTDFDYTTVQIDSSTPFRALFHNLCAAHSVDVNTVAFNWQRKRCGRIQQVLLSPDAAPSHIGMHEGVVETIECEFI